MQPVRHYRVLDDGRIVFSAGLLPRVQQHLEQLGYTVLIDDHSIWEHLQDVDHDLLQTPDLTASDLDFLKSLNKAPFGQIQVPESHTGRCISLMGRLFPQHHLLVAARNRLQVRRLAKEIQAQYGQLAKAQRRPVTTDTRKVWHHDPRMFVGTTQLFRGAFGDEFQIIVFADVQSARAEHCQHLLRDRPDATWYAFTAAQKPRGDYEQFRLEEIFGPVIVDLSRSTLSLDLTVAFMDVPRSAPSCSDGGLVRKREMYWRNDEWN